MNNDYILSSFDQGVLSLTLNRPDALNALNPKMVRMFDEALAEASQRKDVRAVSIAANGRAFCAGVDLKYAQSGESKDHAPTSNFLDELQALLTKIETLPVPVIASVNGLALAGGLEVVLCCDLVVAARSARFGDAHANYGLIPGGGGSVRLPRKIGVTRAKYLLFTGDFFTAQDMEVAGLVNQVVDDEKLAAATQALAKHVASHSPLGLVRMKRLVDEGIEVPQSVALRQELQMIALHRNSADVREGLAAFREKRVPRFTGQ